MRVGQSRKALRIALIFPPAMPPTSPPLGIASLKSYLETSATAEVRNFDLNLAYFEQAFRWLDNGRLRMRLQKMDFKTTAQKAGAARDFFCGREGLSRFFDLALYNEQARIYAGFSSVLNGLFDDFARKILLGLPRPPLVNRFFEELIEPLKAFRPDLIGFSILFSQQLFFALALAKLCKGSGEPASGHRQVRESVETDPVWPPNPAELPRAIGAKIVFGGATFSVMPDPGRLLSGPLCVYQGGELKEVDTSRIIDYLIVGEGERGLESLARRAAEANLPTCKIAAGEEQRGAVAGLPEALCHVPGLLHMEDGKAAGNPAEAAFDLNALPAPDFSDFPLDQYHSPIPVLPYLASRGCPWRRCAFCTHQMTYLDYREEDAANTSDRLVALEEKYGVRHFCLVDEMIHPRRMDRIAVNLIRRGARVYFSAYARPSGFSAGGLAKAHQAGLRLLLWGLESASQRLLDLMRKGTQAQKIPAILNSAREAGVWNLLFLIFGFPTETKAEWQSSLDFLESCKESIHALSRSRFILLEGSDVFRNPKRYGVKRIIDRLQRDPVSIAYDYQVTEGLTQEEAAVMFHESLARLSGIGRSPWFGQFRDHMLLFASAARPQSG
jgi:anaerobic magnesium-protoporphyrin IX monomethyl ester cyclase